MGDQGEMVTESSDILRSLIGTKRMEATVLLINFQQEGGIPDPAIQCFLIQLAAAENMVEVSPLSSKSVSTLGPMLASRLP
jgi:hypothetical protein